MIWVVGLLAVGLLLVWHSLRLRQATGLPWRRVVYQDTQRRQLTRPLYSARYRLTGQPDYLLGADSIPVEVKPTRHDQAPRQGDIMQVAAYCLLVEETTGRPPPYGLLRYASATFEIRWDDDLYAQLLDTLEALRHDRRCADVPRSHNDARRCRACGFADRCRDALQ